MSGSREIANIYVITTVTKTLAKAGEKVFKRELNYDWKLPKLSTNKVVAKVHTKEKESWSSPDYFLVVI